MGWEWGRRDGCTQAAPLRGEDGRRGVHVMGWREVGGGAEWQEGGGGGGAIGMVVWE